jgi:hypothetical protein
MIPVYQDQLEKAFLKRHVIFETSSSFRLNVRNVALGD